MIKYILFLVIAITVGVFLQKSSPDVSFTYNNLLIKIPTWQVISGILIILFLQNWLFKIATSNWLKNKRTNKSLKYAKKIFLSLIAGKIDTAENYSLNLNNLININNNSQFNWLLSLFNLMKSELYYNQGNHELALIELNKLHKKLPNNQLILSRLTTTYQSLNDWQQLIKLLPTLKKYQTYTQFDYQQLEFKAYKERLEQIINTNTESIDLASYFFKQSPKPLKQNPQFILSYVNCLLRFKYYDLAENIIKTSLTNNLDVNNTNIINLITLYGVIKSNNIKQQIKTAENWISKYPNNLAILLTLGRLCINESLWGKAKNYLEQAIHIHPDPACYSELGRLAEILGDQQKSFSCYQKGYQIKVIP
jgi:heme biosynthesis-associated TPR repeat protein